MAFSAPIDKPTERYTLCVEGMHSDTVWSDYIRARNAHFSAHERLLDRTQGISSIEPSDVSRTDLASWLGLLRDVETSAREHVVALERYRLTRL